MKRLLAFHLTLFSFQLVGQEIVKLSKQDIQVMDSLVEKFFEESKIPGMAIGFVNKGKVLYKKTLGVRMLGSNLEVTDESIFHMASISKTFVATAIIQLSEQGKININNKLTDYLSYFKLKDERYKDITIKQVLLHTAGLPDIRNYHWNNPELSEDAREKWVRALSNKKLLFAPGERDEYSNIGYDILAHVVDKVSGMSFEAYMKAYLLKPSGMKNSTFFYPEVPENLRNKGHVGKTNPRLSKVYPYNRVHAGSSTLNASLNEMLRFMIMYMDHGKYDGNILFSETSFEMLIKKELTFNEQTGRSLGWFLRPSSGGVHDYGMIAHSGGDTGFQCWYGLVPGKKWGMVYMLNGDWDTPSMQDIFSTGQQMADKYD